MRICRPQSLHIVLDGFWGSSGTSTARVVNSNFVLVVVVAVNFVFQIRADLGIRE